VYAVGTARRCGFAPVFGGLIQTGSRAWMVVGFSWLALAALRLTRLGLVERVAL
jgi:hypothetical protein